MSYIIYHIVTWFFFSKYLFRNEISYIHIPIPKLQLEMSWAIFTKWDTYLHKSKDFLLNLICILLFSIIVSLLCLYLNMSVIQIKLGLIKPILGPCHTKTCLPAYANSQGPDQPAHLRSLIKAFIVRGQNHWILQNVWIESKGPNDILRMRWMI